jgi:Na+/H+ antiporter NhaD/arsenite permease-like protein
VCGLAADTAVRALRVVEAQVALQRRFELGRPRKVSPAEHDAPVFNRIASSFTGFPAVILWHNTVASLPDPQLMWRIVAMSSTFGGNLLLIGSIANLIVVERAEQRGVRIGFGEYARIGVPVTVLTIVWGIAVLVVTR